MRPAGAAPAEPPSENVQEDLPATGQAATDGLTGPKAPGPAEHGGPKGPDPTRYGDWERAGRCIDF
ncbi:MAG: DUF1674 domain-containing protein [Chromatiales bacterium]|nr:DUF1674 domain-containing protein [Chromatiales bacterium]